MPLIRGQSGIKRFTPDLLKRRAQVQTSLKLTPVVAATAGFPRSAAFASRANKRTEKATHKKQNTLFPRKFAMRIAWPCIG
jgi:hypothetical protein